MNGKHQKKKAAFGSNEAPARRWVAFFIVAHLCAIFASAVVQMVLRGWTMTGSYSWLPSLTTSMLSFAASFALTVGALHLICKQSLRDLILGAGKGVDWGQARKVAVAYLTGFVLSLVVCSFIPGSSDGELALNSIGIVPIVVNFVVCLALVWMQTTWEEIAYRAIFLRATCKDNIRPTVASIGVGIIANLIFMACHLNNPEVTTQSTFELAALMASTYFISGFAMYISDVVFGNCLPGCIIHWMNNFLIFAFFTQKDIVLASGALFTSEASPSGFNNFIGTALLYLPVFILLVVEARKKKAAA